MEKNGGSSNEKWLFHGSISTVISDICAQNLDWRLCGLNGTAIGRGTYFARESSYSDTYSKPDSNGYKYMFIAQVLVGQFTTVSAQYAKDLDTPFCFLYNLFRGHPPHRLFFPQIPLFDNVFSMFCFSNNSSSSPETKNKQNKSIIES